MKQDKQVPKDPGNRSGTGDLASTQSPEERRAELKQKIGQRVMAQVMGRVGTQLDQSAKNTDIDLAKSEIDVLLDEYSKSGGDSEKLKSTIDLLDLDDDGIKMIADLLLTANHGLGSERGSEFFTEAYSSTQKIMGDLMKTGTARIIGPDGKLYDMNLIAMDDDEETEDMPESLSGSETRKPSIAGMYSLGQDSRLADNLLHGEIIAESSVSEIESVLNQESNNHGTKYTALETYGQIGYSFSKSVSQLDDMSCGSYDVFFDGVPGVEDVSIHVPATFWYAKHRNYQWEISKIKTPIEDEPVKPEPIEKKPTESTSSKPPKKLAVELRPVDVKTAPADDSTDSNKQPEDDRGYDKKKPVLGRLASAMRMLEERRAAAEREISSEIYNSVFNYFKYALPKASIHPDGSFDKGLIENFGSFIKSGEDNFSEVIGDCSSLMVMADGMGGQYGGAEASKLTVRAFLEDIGLTKISGNDRIEDIIGQAIMTMAKRIEKAREALNEFNLKNNSDAGATVVSAEVIGNKLVYGSVGDSSIFVVRGGEFILVAGDRGGHGSGINSCIGGYKPGTGGSSDFVPLPENLLEDAGRIDDLARRERSGDSVALTKLRQISFYDSVGVFELNDGDRVVLCTDGIMGDWSQIENLSRREGVSEQTLTDEEIVGAIDTDKTLDGVREAMVRLMKAAKKQDDRSVQMFDIKLQ